MKGLQKGEAVAPIRKASTQGNRKQFKEHNIKVGESVTKPPREIMTKLFEIQGIPLDPSEIEIAVEKLKGVIGTGYGDGETKYDCFINYRVATDSDLAEKLFLYLKTANIHAFLDRKCLKNGEKWKDGFLKGTVINDSLFIYYT